MVQGHPCPLAPHLTSATAVWGQSWGPSLTPSHLSQVAVKIIDKTQLNSSSLQKVRAGGWDLWEGGSSLWGDTWGIVASHSLLPKTHSPPYSSQLFREVRIMKVLNHPNIGEPPPKTPPAACWDSRVPHPYPWGGPPPLGGSQGVAPTLACPPPALLCPLCSEAF